MSKLLDRSDARPGFRRWLKEWIGNLPIQRKLWLFTAVSGAIAGVVASTLLIGLSIHNERIQLTIEAQRVAAIVAENALPALRFRSPETASEILAGLGRDHEIVSARILDADGSVFARFDAASRAGRMVLRSQPIVVRAPMSINEPAIGFIELTKDPSDTLSHQVETVVISVAIATLVALVLGGLLIVRLHRIITNPLADLTRLMQEVTSASDFSRRAAVPNRDELGRLGSSFNKMIETLEERNVALGRELAERLRAEKQLEHLAHHDQVTGLPNRYLLRQRLDDLSRYAGKDEGAYVLLFVDLDNFKNVNDTFGHDIGDRLLVAVAERLAAAVRSRDFVARFGGDEFVLLLDGIDDEFAVDGVGAKVLEAVTGPVDIDGHRFVVTCSIGIALAGVDSKGADDLLQRADAAMYAAKHSGKNCVRRWQPAMSSDASARFELEVDLRQALARGEIALHYQPIIELASGRIAGMEALMRWHHPRRGFVSPDKFIPVAEDTGLIMELGTWAMETAFAQAADWNQRIGPLFVAVNVSARQFGDPDFVARLEAIANASGLDRQFCELELTESMIMGNTAATIHRLSELHERGFSLAIDDFGTGYSSLAYLNRFPLDKLKIDRSFVAGVPHDHHGTSIAEAIIGLAATLSLRVVAEGIETAAQADALRQRRCQYAQGFYFSRPLPSEQFERFFIESRSGAKGVVGDAVLAGGVVSSG